MSNLTMRDGQTELTRSVTDFGVTDDRGRAVGALVVISTVEFVPIPEGQTWGYRVDAGKYVEVNTQAQRGGKRFGASTATKLFANRSEADEHAAGYLDRAAKRASKKWGA